MATTKPRKTEPSKAQAAVSAAADHWIRQFITHFEERVIDASRSLPPDASVPELQMATARAILATYLDAGTEFESTVELLGQAAVERHSGDAVWSDALNRRRFALIDKEIQASLTPAETVELAGLTRMMRAHVESETNLPMQGARALHRQLLRRKSTGEPD